MNNSNNKSNATAELLTQVYSNVTMGSENLATAVSKVKDKFMVKNITAQLEQYAQYEKETEALLNRQAIKPEQPSAIKKLISKSEIILTSSINHTDSHMAEIISADTHKRARQLENKMCELKKCGADEATLELCRRVVDFERTEGDKIKEYM